MASPSDKEVSQSSYKILKAIDSGFKMLYLEGRRGNVKVLCYLVLFAYLVS